MKKLIGIIVASALALLTAGASVVTVQAAGEYKNASYEGGELFLAQDMSSYEAQQIRDAF